MAEILPWQPNESCSLVMRHLVLGDCVALPTESTYELVASALHPDAVARLRQVGQPAVVISDHAELADWLPLLRGAAARLIRKMGAGPITLYADAGFASGLWSRLPQATRQQVVQDNRIAVRCPDQPIWGELRQAGIPLVSTPIPAAVNAAETARLLRDRAACIVDAGPTSIAAMPTVVRSVGRRCVVQQPGAVSAEQIDELAQCRIVFICTGNTCRSPMAQALCAKLLADALGCAPGQLKERGYCVQSAGLAAMTGAEASSEAVSVAAELGAELKEHSSQMVTLELLQWADFLFGMTAGHCWTLESIPVPMPAPRMLAIDGTDVSDPIGGAQSDYKTCAHQILESLQQRLPELLES
jgi:L-threonylcarbamoyladenylate synthase